MNPRRRTRHVRSFLRERSKAAVTTLGWEAAARRGLALATSNARRDAQDNRHLKMVLAATLRPASNCLDVGANRGDVLQQMVRVAPLGKHVAVEALPELAALLSRFEGVVVHQVAATDVEGDAEFTRAIGAEGYSRLSSTIPLNVPTTKFTVRTARLDDLVPPDHRIDFVKIDVEGAEFSALLGARRILTDHRPALWVEHKRSEAGSHGAGSTALWDYLCGELDYRIFDADGDGPISRDAIRPQAGSPRMWNWLARPR